MAVDVHPRLVPNLAYNQPFQYFTGGVNVDRPLSSLDKAHADADVGATLGITSLEEDSGMAKESVGTQQALINEAATNLNPHLAKSFIARGAKQHALDLKNKHSKVGAIVSSVSAEEEGQKRASQATKAYQPNVAKQIHRGFYDNVQYDSSTGTWNGYSIDDLNFVDYVSIPKRINEVGSKVKPTTKGGKSGVYTINGKDYITESAEGKRQVFKVKRGNKWETLSDKDLKDVFSSHLNLDSELQNSMKEVARQNAWQTYRSELYAKDQANGVAMAGNKDYDLRLNKQASRYLLTEEGKKSQEDFYKEQEKEAIEQTARIYGYNYNYKDEDVVIDSAYASGQNKKLKELPIVELPGRPTTITKKFDEWRNEKKSSDAKYDEALEKFKSVSNLDFNAITKENEENMSLEEIDAFNDYLAAKQDKEFNDNLIKGAEISSGIDNVGKFVSDGFTKEGKHKETTPGLQDKHNDVVAIGKELYKERFINGLRQGLKFTDIMTMEEANSFKQELANKSDFLELESRPDGREELNWGLDVDVEHEVFILEGIYNDLKENYDSKVSGRDVDKKFQPIIYTPLEGDDSDVTNYRKTLEKLGDDIEFTNAMDGTHGNAKTLLNNAIFRSEGKDLPDKDEMYDVQDMKVSYTTSTGKMGRQVAYVSGKYKDSKGDLHDTRELVLLEYDNGKTLSNTLDILENTPLTETSLKDARSTLNNQLKLYAGETFGVNDILLNSVPKTKDSKYDVSKNNKSKSTDLIFRNERTGKPMFKYRVLNNNEIAIFNKDTGNPIVFRQKETGNNKNANIYNNWNTLLSELGAKAYERKVNRDISLFSKL